MAVRAVKDKLKTSKSLPQVLSSCTLCNLVLGTEIGTRYRYIDDTPLVPLSEAAAGGGSSAAAGGAKTRSRASSEYVLYSHGAPAAVNSDDGTSYFGTDILGSVRNVTDKYGAVQSSYDYDAFGSPYLGNLENDIGFGYCGKVYDVGTGLYDYGFRDYSPVSARFTTVDPIRDGSNWFSYVVNDPVNYVDPFGLNAFDDFIYGKQETIEVDGQKITVQQSSPLLETLAKAKDKASDKLINWGNKTGIKLFTKLGESVSQIPTGRVDNQTNYYLAFAGEHSKLGEAYLAPNSVTYLFKDYVVTRGESSGMTAKMISIGDVTVNQSEIIFSPATKKMNNVANNLKTSLSKSCLSQLVTTELYDIYKNTDLLNSSDSSTATKLSGNLKVFAGKIKSNDGTNYSNPQYFQENSNNSTNTSDVVFENINLNNSGNPYIGFNGFSGGCTK